MPWEKSLETNGAATSVNAHVSAPDLALDGIYEGQQISKAGRDDVERLGDVGNAFRPDAGK